MSDIIDLRAKTGRKKRKWRYIIAAVGVVVIWLGGSGVMLGNDYRELRGGVARIQDLVKIQDFQNLEAETKLVHETIKRTEKHLLLLAPLRVIPYLGYQIKALTMLTSAANEMIEPLPELIKKSIPSLDLLAGDINYRSLSDAQKVQLITALTSILPEFNGLERAFNEAEANISQIDSTRLISTLRGPVAELQSQLYNWKAYLRTGRKLIDLVPDLAGYPEANQFLLLQFNNAELRATGGFIGSFSVVNIENGDLSIDSESEDVYNLDDNDAEYPAAPEWFVSGMNGANTDIPLRDSSIVSSDAPKTFARTLDTYYDILGGTRQFDGIIGLTPTFLSYLLKVTGPITVEGYPYEFTSSEVEAQLNEYIQKDYALLGVGQSGRKEILSDLSKKVLESVFDLPRDKWGDLLAVLDQGFAARQIMIYLNDEDGQEKLRAYNWAGAVTSDWRGDYFMLVDNNLAAKKTDLVMERELKYQVSEDAGRLKAEVTVIYRHLGDGITDYLTRYRTSGWILAPAGSELISDSGIDSGDYAEGQDRGESYSDNEDSDLGKVRFHFFKSIEPGTEESFSISYWLPAGISANEYSLLVEPQPGTTKNLLELIFPNGATFTGDLRTSYTFGE